METGKEFVVPLLKLQPYAKIYHRTKNRRIKKKQLKASHMLRLQLEIAKYIGTPKNYEVYVGGRKIGKN